MFKADRTTIKVDDLIAAQGPRLADVANDRVNGIRQQWIQCWSIAAGHRASMTIGTP